MTHIKTAEETIHETFGKHADVMPHYAWMAYKNKEITELREALEALQKQIELLHASPQQEENVWIKVNGEHFDVLQKEHENVLLIAKDAYNGVDIVHGFYFKRLDGRIVWYQNSDFCSAGTVCIDHDELNVTHWMYAQLPPIISQGE